MNVKGKWVIIKRMCNRFTIRIPQAVLAHQFGVEAGLQLPLRFNVCPSTQIPVVRQTGERRELAMLKWGLVPAWSDEPKVKYSTFNAKSEEAAGKPAYRAAMKNRRCLILADGYYEWEEVNKKKVPHYFQLRGQQPFAFAGLWERWNKAEPALETCTLLTTRANELQAKYHDRMPVILSPNDYAAWLDPANTDPKSLAYMFEPFPSNEMTDTPANPYVNKAGNEGPECLTVAG
jgi:putative SOS response-associated peptidase YedK